MKQNKCALESEVKNKVVEFRKKFNIAEQPIKDIYSLEFTKEFFILRFPFNKEISGAYIEKRGREEKIYRCIYINTAEPIGRLSFSFMHEVYHAYFEKSEESLVSYNQSSDPIEKKANLFASYLLIPRNYLENRLQQIRKGRSKWYISEEQIFDLQKEFGVSFLAIIVAIDELGDYTKPINLKQFYKYKHKRYWNELELRTLRYDKMNDLNSCKPSIEWPNGLKENIEKNIEDGIVFREDVVSIFEFFEH